MDEWGILAVLLQDWLDDVVLLDGNHSINYRWRYLSYTTIATNISLGVFVAIAFVVPISYSSATYFP